MRIYIALTAILEDLMKLFHRTSYLKKLQPFYDSDPIKVITGIRRCGKSCLIKPSSKN